MKKQRKKWPLEKQIAVFLLIFGALVIVIPVITAMTATEAPFTAGQAKGILISGFGIMEAGAVVGTVYRRKAGKDISFAIGACIGILIVGILQIFG